MYTYRSLLSKRPTAYIHTTTLKYTRILNTILIKKTRSKYKDRIYSQTPTRDRTESESAPELSTRVKAEGVGPSFSYSTDTDSIVRLPCQPCQCHTAAVYVVLPVLDTRQLHGVSSLDEARLMTNDPNLQIFLADAM